MPCKQSGGMCSAIGCTMEQIYDKTNKERGTNKRKQRMRQTERRGTNLLSQVKMFAFPRNPARRSAWATALRRQNWTPTNNSLICGSHFITGQPSSDPNHQDYIPSIFKFSKDAAQKGKNKLKRYERNAARKRDGIILENIASTISNTEANVVDDISLEEVKDFVEAFKIRRKSLGLTQAKVGQALSATEGRSYSQSTICRFEKFDISPRKAQKIKPLLERQMKEAEERYKNGTHTLTEFIGSEPTKKRKKRTLFTSSALDILNQFFENNTRPSGAEITGLAEHLNYDREVVRVWFCNKRQALKKHY